MGGTILWGVQNIIRACDTGTHSNEKVMIMICRGIKIIASLTTHL